MRTRLGKIARRDRNTGSGIDSQHPTFDPIANALGRGGLLDPALLPGR
jgi:hypothetical protein